MTFEEISGVQTDTGKKILIYGQEGVGKTTLASQFPNPVFIDCEGSTTMMNVKRLPKPESWKMLCDETDFILECRKYQSVVIDTFDWAERLALEELCQEHKVNGIEGFGYGKGWQYEAEKIGKYLDKLDKLISAGINVILLCHAITKKMTLPEDVAEYDHWELKLGSKTTNKIAPLLKEWSDMTLFLAFRTNIVAVSSDGKKNKATNVERVMYTTKTAWWDAKNRFNFPDVLPLKYESIARIFQPVAEQMIAQAKEQNIPVSPIKEETLEDFQPIGTENFDGLPKNLTDLMQKANVYPSQIEFVSSEIFKYFPKDMKMQNYPADYFDYLVNDWQNVFKAVQAECKDYLPFE